MVSIFSPHFHFLFSSVDCTELCACAISHRIAAVCQIFLGVYHWFSQMARIYIHIFHIKCCFHRIEEQYSLVDKAVASQCKGLDSLQEEINRFFFLLFLRWKPQCKLCGNFMSFRKFKPSKVLPRSLEKKIIRAGLECFF